MTSDCIADSLGNHGGGAPAPRRKQQKSLGRIFAWAAYSLVGLADGYGEEDYEYHDNKKDDGGDGGDYYDANHCGGSVPSIAALADLPRLANNTADDGDARVATLYSDSSLCIWTARPSQNQSATNG